MNGYSRWAAILGALLLAAVVGVMAYNAGVAHGIQQSGKIVVAPPGAPAAAPYPYPYPYYGWHPWGFGFFFGPLILLFVFFSILRAVFWRAAWRRGAYGAYGACGPGGRMEEWHRQMHERMAGGTTAER